ncbi:MAG: Addiction module component, CHP02574 [Planctomycetaceae bacterium]|jgi:putative addiction module component (TIGR02574 family)|nr:MAG: Addiction module component, CHP02574 [Planctomycetaceae bacterium]
MSIDFADLRALSPAEKLELVELLWDDLGASDASIPLPEWVGLEAARRRDELIADPKLGLSHEEVWRRIEQRNR